MSADRSPETTHTRPWIAERLRKAAETWDSIPEHTKPVVNSPYFARRADQPERTNR